MKGLGAPRLQIPQTPKVKAKKSSENQIKSPQASEGKQKEGAM